MTYDLSTIPSWIPSTALSAVAWILMSWKRSGVTEAEMNLRMDQLRKDLMAEKTAAEKNDTRFLEEIEGLRGELRDALAEFRAATLQVARLGSSQEVVNSITGKTIESLINKYEALAHQTNENAASIRILSELMSRVALPQQQGD